MSKKKEGKTDFKIDWKEVKATVSMEMVLDRYGLKLRRVNATALRGKCPLPTHSADSTSPESFNVSLIVIAHFLHRCISAHRKDFEIEFDLILIIKFNQLG